MLRLADILTNLFHLAIFATAMVVFARAIIFRLKLIAKGQKIEKLAPVGERIRSFLFNVLFQEKLFKHPVRGIMHAFIFYGFIVYSVLHTLSQMVAGNIWSLLVLGGFKPYTFWLADYTWLGISLSGVETALTLIGLFASIFIVFAIYKNFKVSKSFSLEKSAAGQWAVLGVLLALTGAIFLITVGSGLHTYEGIVQHFTILVLVGLIFFGYRRWIRRAKGLDIPSTASAIVISLISSLMLSTLASSAAQAMLDGGALKGSLGDSLAASFTTGLKGHASWISVITLYLLNGAGMITQADATAVRDFSWWVHIASVYIFMVYIPTSKHSHLIFAPINFFLIKGTPRGQIRMMDLENATSYGAGNVTELTWPNLMDGMSCIECGRCTIQCPANRTGKLLDPKRIIVEIKHSMLAHSAEISAQEEGAIAAAPLIGDPYISDEELWGCTSCYACVEACPVGNNQVDAIMEMRRNLVLVESRIPKELQLAFTNMENNSNPWGVGAHTRADWAKDLNVKTMAEDSKVDVLYWVGCAGSFDERNKTIARSFVQIMQQAKVNFAILGTEENCTGDSARRGGNEYLYQTLAMSNIETLNRYNVKKIVTACPHCYNALKNEYPQMGGNYDVVHHSDFIDNLIRDGKVEMDPAAVSKMKEKRAVYHDSCYLGRYNDIYEEPRDVLKKALGMDLSEASDHHKTSLCCGAGGAQMWMEEHYERVNVKRTNQLVDTGADTIATACPFCITMITDGVKSAHLENSVKVLDIAEIVSQSMKGGNGASASGGFAKAAH